MSDRSSHHGLGDVALSAMKKKTVDRDNGYKIRSRCIAVAVAADEAVAAAVADNSVDHSRCWPWLIWVLVESG